VLLMSKESDDGGGVNYRLTEQLETHRWRPKYRSDSSWPPASNNRNDGRPSDPGHFSLDQRGSASTGGAYSSSAEKRYSN
jgi:hypothetical protein